ncbi:MAG: hypothetical protein VKI83_09680 [Synechococcaceae cyanobacterium]|nr:hypothetical protein [Synechococcaceae cyanobacterium]
MALPDNSTYRIPSCLRDLVMVDLLELTGSTMATAAMLEVSQPSVSRRYRALAGDLGLARQNHRPVGSRYGDTDWMVLLRRGVNRHRLSCGVLRIGGPPSLGDGLRDCCWAEWVKLGRQPLAHWPQLLELELLDAFALEEAGPLEDRADAADLVLVEIRRSIARPLLLACRRDPLIMEIASRLSHRLEVP